MKLALLSLVVLVSSLAVPVRASEDLPANCKLVVRTKLHSGKRKLQILETYAADREDCRWQARERELSSEDTEVASVKATWGWRGTVSR